MKMTEEELQKIVDKASDKSADKAAVATVQELKRQGMLKDGFTPFQKTEKLLFNYNKFKDAIKEHENDIKDIMKYGVKQKSKSITSYPGGTRSNTDEYEKVAEKVGEIYMSCEKTKCFIAILENALGKLKDDPYFEIIPKYYFEEKTHEVIADEMGVNNGTVSRNRKRLIKDLSIMLFSDKVIEDIYFS
jgi:RNA polymerase sigma factor (sigma-70 family)